MIQAARGEGQNCSLGRQNPKAHLKAKLRSQALKIGLQQSSQALRGKQRNCGCLCSRLSLVRRRRSRHIGLAGGKRVVAGRRFQPTLCGGCPRRSSPT